VDAHRLAELRSLALHRVVATCIAADPSLIGEARRRLAFFRESGALHPFLHDQWAKLLDGPSSELLRVLVEDSEHARELRQATPFAGVVSPRERWRIWRAVRSAS
jgi:hypothetical protein